MKRLLSLFLLIGLTSGCASLTPDAKMKSWMGQSAHTAILQWGPPAQEVGDGADGKVLTWRYWVPASFIPYVGWVGNYWQTRSFYVRADGTIYAYRWQGI